MGEAQDAASVDQRLLQRGAERGPDGRRELREVPRPEQAEDLGLGQAPAGAGEEAEGLADQVLAVAVVVALPAGDRLSEEGGDVLRGEVVGETLVDAVVGARDAELVEEDLQVEGVRGGRGGGKAREAGPVQLLAEAPEAGGDHPAALGFVERRHVEGRLRPAALLDGVPGVAGEGGDDQAEAAGEGVRREPGEAAGAVAVLELVQGVEDDHEAHPLVLGLRAGLREPDRERSLEVLVRAGRLLRVAGPIPDLRDETTHDPPVVRAVRRRADVVLEHELPRTGLAPVRDPVREERGLAASRLAEHHEGAAVALRVAVEPLQVLRPADPRAAPGLREGLVLPRLPGEGVGDLLLRELRRDRGFEILPDPVREGPRVGVVLAERDSPRRAGLADPLLQRVLLRPRLLALRGEGGAPGPRVGGVPEVEEGAAGHRRGVQDPVEDLQLGDAPLRELTEPGLLLLEVGRERVVAGDPAVALAEEPDEVRAAGADLVQAELQRLPARALLLGDAPAEVHLHELDVPLAAEPAERRPGMGHQRVPVLLHVPEGGGDEDADTAVRRLGAHGSIFLRSRRPVTRGGGQPKVPSKSQNRAAALRGAFRGRRLSPPETS